ncbi:MAG TPA: co-chaperone GroES [Chlamydiales bacterium]|nr:co-chaperone GroES [Chlamydiales bacterium]
MAQETINKTKLKPLGNRVLVQRLEPQETMKGGIILPDSAKKKQEMAKVISVGPGKRLDDGVILPPSVEIGDLVLIATYAGQEVTIDNEEFVLVKADDDIIAVIEE